jgi:tetratricopeptide (TPR) repeat protein
MKVTTMNTLNTSKIPLAQMILALSTACMLNGIGQLPASAAESAALANQISQVTQYYTSKNYTAAISAADALLATNNQNADLHYLKGDALRAIGKMQAAAIEYRAAIALHPPENVARYCAQALGTMPPGMAYTPMPAQGTSAYNASLAIYNDMNQQATTLENAATQAGTALTQDADNFASSTEQQAAKTVAAMEATGSYHHGTWQSAYSAEAMNAVTDQAAQRAARLSAQSAASAQSFTAQANEKANLTVEAATNLQSLLNTPTTPGAAQLNPVGTNLFVRNYGSATSAKPLVAQAGLLPAAPAALKATPSSLHITKPGTTAASRSAQVKVTISGKVIGAR